MGDEDRARLRDLVVERHHWTGWPAAIVGKRLPDLPTRHDTLVGPPEDDGEEHGAGKDTLRNGVEEDELRVSDQNWGLSG